MSDDPKHKHDANRQADKLDQGSPADAEQDEKPPTGAGKKAADSTRHAPKESASWRR